MWRHERGCGYASRAQQQKGEAPNALDGSRSVGKGLVHPERLKGANTIMCFFADKLEARFRFRQSASVTHDVQSEPKRFRGHSRLNNVAGLLQSTLL